MSERPPTNEELMRVRRWECGVRGHDWRFIELVGSAIPKGMICDRCGQAARIVAEDPPANLGEHGHDAWLKHLEKENR